MGYNIYITLKQFHFDDEPRISLEDWRALVNSDPELFLSEFSAYSNDDGSEGRFEHPGRAIWLGWSCHENDGCSADLYYENGDICVKNPDREIVCKLFQIAVKLRAGVQGDDLEFYDKNAEPIVEKELNNNQDCDGQSESKPWWKFW